MEPAPATVVDYSADQWCNTNCMVKSIQYESIERYVAATYISQLTPERINLTTAKPPLTANVNMHVSTPCSGIAHVIPTFYTTRVV